MGRESLHYNPLHIEVLDKAKTWILMNADLVDAKCEELIELPMGWIKKCRKDLVTYYEVEDREIKAPTDDTAIMFEIAYAEDLLPAVYMYAGFKVVLSHSGLYLHTRDMADWVVSKDVTDLAAHISARVEFYVAMCNREKYKERKREELRSKYKYRRS